MADAPAISDGRAQNGAIYAREADFGGPRAQNQAFYARETSGADVAGSGRVAIVAVASNSSLCGAFNINVVHRVQELVAECKAAGAGVEVISVGRKMAEAMRKMGFAPEDHADLVGRNSFEKSSAFAQELIDAFNAGRYTRILLVYNHFVSTASQKVQTETYLPFASALTDGLYPPQAGLTAPPSGAGPLPLHPWADRASGGSTSPAEPDAPQKTSASSVQEPQALVGNGWRLVLQEGAFGRLGGMWPELGGCPYVSGSHGAVSKDPAGWKIVDNGSTNGTYVNGMRIKTAVLKKGDRVRIATLDFTVE